MSGPSHFSNPSYSPDGHAIVDKALREKGDLREELGKSNCYCDRCVGLAKKFWAAKFPYKPTE